MERLLRLIKRKEQVAHDLFMQQKISKNPLQIQDFNQYNLQEKAWFGFIQDISIRVIGLEFKIFMKINTEDMFS